MTDLLRREDFTLARANLQKFLIRNLLEVRIRELRRQAVGKAYQQVLFGDDAAARVAVIDRYAFEFHPQGWAAAEDDRLIGSLWANLSEGRCRFVMVKEQQWDGIEKHLM